jgi:hypothetical protein
MLGEFHHVGSAFAGMGVLGAHRDSSGTLHAFIDFLKDVQADSTKMTRSNRFVR